MATTISNQASTNYQFSGSSDVLTANSNISDISLESSQGLSIIKSANVDSFAVGEIINYTVQITNNSSHYLNGVRIIDNLDFGKLAYVIGSAKLTVGTLTYPVTPIATNPLTFTLQQLNVGASMTLTYNAQVIFNLPSSVQSITNSIQGIGYTSSGTINGFSSYTIQKKTNGDFSLTKSSSQTSVLPNQIFNYYLTFLNNTSEVATLISVTDNLPSNFVVTGVYYKIGNGPNIELSTDEYTLVATNTITIPSATGPSIIVPANGSTLITIEGYFA